MSWFWCLDHQRVEQDFGCGSTTRIGPCESQALAASALARTRRRKAEQEIRDAADQQTPQTPARARQGPAQT